MDLVDLSGRWMYPCARRMLLVTFLSLGHNIGHSQLQGGEVYFGLSFRGFTHHMDSWLWGQNGTMQETCGGKLFTSWCRWSREKEMIQSPSKIPASEHMRIVEVILDPNHNKGEIFQLHKDRRSCAECTCSSGCCLLQWSFIINLGNDLL